MQRLCLAAAALVLALTACTRYETRIVPFKLPEAYQNFQNIEGAKIAAFAYDDPDTAEKAFGFDIRGAGLLPVQVVFDNQSRNSLHVDPTHTYLVDKEGNLWPVMESRLAYERIEKKTEMARIASGAGKQSFLAGAAGAVIGAAIGIVTGENIGEAMGKGAAVGAAAGATIGGAEAYGSHETRHRIIADLEKKSLENKPIGPGQIAHGFVFFPGESKSAKEFRLQLLEVGTGKVHNLILPF
ncbi:MAG: hypothetical protein V1736_05355 [Pseudomonadota bacterium]